MADTHYEHAHPGVDSAERQALLASLARFQGPQVRRSIAQLATRCLPTR